MTTESVSGNIAFNLLNLYTSAACLMFEQSRAKVESLRQESRLTLKVNTGHIPTPVNLCEKSMLQFSIFTCPAGLETRNAHNHSYIHIYSTKCIEQCMNNQRTTSPL